MIIGLDEALRFAEDNNIGLAAINTPFFEGLLGTIEAAEKVGVPVILQFAQVHEGIVSIEDMGPAMVDLAKRSSAPFVLHVDHGADVDYIRKGLDIGFNSAMIDGSTHDYATNVALTREVVELASERGIAVEGEIGVMTGNENGDPDQGIADSSLYTDPELAARFVAETGVSCLAASFGTVHGVYRVKPKLDFELISKLREATGVPIVMHGGSGLSTEEYHECIRHGVRKINYYTYLAKASYDAVLPLIDNPDVILFSNLAIAAREGARANAAAFIETCAATRTN